VSVLSLFGDREFVHKVLCTSTKNTPITVILSPAFACNLIFNPSQPLNAAGNRTSAYDWHLDSTRWLSLSTLHAEHGMHVRCILWNLLLPPAGSVIITTWQIHHRVRVASSASQQVRVQRELGRSINLKAAN
jgi:hypothetical protein